MFTLCWESRTIARSLYLKARSRSEYSFICFAYCQEILPNLCLPGSFDLIFSTLLRHRETCPMSGESDFYLRFYLIMFHPGMTWALPIKHQSVNPRVLTPFSAGTNSSKILCLMFVYIFVLCRFVSWLILWFDDLRAEQTDRLNTAFQLWCNPAWLTQLIIPTNWLTCLFLCLFQTAPYACIE